MQLLQEANNFLVVGKNFNGNNKLVREPNHYELKEKKSSLLVMNPVASGDNVTTGLTSAHKLKDEAPSLVPCCEGKELLINEDLVRSGLSAISVKHDSVIQCLSLSRASELLKTTPGLVKNRNSFRSLHRPDLKRVPYLRRLTPDDLETLFKGYADLPTRCPIKTDLRQESMLSSNTYGESMCRNKKDDKNLEACNNEGASLHPLLEAKAGSEDVPAGMRLHVARARLYTSVLAGAKTGDHVESEVSPEEEHPPALSDPLPEDEVVRAEQLQVLLPPRIDDHTDSQLSNDVSQYSTAS